MSNSKHKKKSVHLDGSLHKKLKNRATDRGSTIQKEINDILKKELNHKKKKKK